MLYGKEASVGSLYTMYKQHDQKRWYFHYPLCVCARLHVCACMYVCSCVYVCVCICVYMNAYYVCVYVRVCAHVCDGRT